MVINSHNLPASLCNTPLQGLYGIMHSCITTYSPGLCPCAVCDYCSYSCIIFHTALVVIPLYIYIYIYGFHVDHILNSTQCHMCICVLGKSQFTVNGLVFGVSIGVMGLLILIITIVLTAMLIRSQKQASKLTTTNRHIVNERNSEPTNAPEQSSTAIDTERNVAYISLADARQSVQALHA